MRSAVLSAFAAVILAVVAVAATGGGGSSSSSSSSSSSGAAASFTKVQYASVPQLWSVLPTTNVSGGQSLILESVVNASCTLLLLWTAAGGQLTSIAVNTADPTVPAQVYGSVRLANIVSNLGTVLYATAADTPRGAVVVTSGGVVHFPDLSFGFDDTPSIFAPDQPFLGAVECVSTGLLLLISATQLSWWSTSLVQSGPFINLTTPFVGAVTGQCSVDGVCWLGDTVATYVVVYASSTTIQTMAMGQNGQWRGGAQLPEIRVAPGRRAVTTWGPYVGLLTSQNAGNLGLDWYNTLNSNITAVSVFPSTGPRGTVAVGYGATIMLLDLAGGSPLGNNGVVTSPLNGSYWTTIQLDTSGSPTLVTAAGMNCGASWAVENATGALTTVAPLWTAPEMAFLGFGATVRTAFTTSASSSGAVQWYIDLSMANIFYQALIISPRQQKALYSVQLPQHGATLISAYAAGRDHFVALVLTGDAPNSLVGFDVAAAPALVPVLGQYVASTYDPSTQTTFLVTSFNSLLLGVYQVSFGSATKSIITAWNAVNTTGTPGEFSAVELVYSADTATLFFYATWSALSAFQTVGYAAVIDVAAKSLLYHGNFPGGFRGTFISRYANYQLTYASQKQYCNVDHKGDVTCQPYNSTALSNYFGYIAQWQNRVMLEVGYGGYAIVRASTGAVLFSQSSQASAGFTQDGGVVECVSDPNLNVNNLNLRDSNFNLVNFSIAVGCVGVPMQTPDGSVYFAAVSNYAKAGASTAYLARANFAQPELTPAVELGSFSNVGTPRLTYSATNQLMLVNWVVDGYMACVDLITGQSLWGMSTGNSPIQAPVQLDVAGAKNVLWNAVGQLSVASINLFTGTTIESFVTTSSLYTGIFVGTVTRDNGVTRAALTVTGPSEVATWTNSVVGDVAAPANFRSSSLPLFNVSSASVLPLQPIIPIITPPPFPNLPTPSSSDSSGTFIGIGAGVGVCGAGSVLGYLIRTKRRRAAAAAGYHVMPTVAVGAPVRTAEGVTNVIV